MKINEFTLKLPKYLVFLKPDSFNTLRGKLLLPILSAVIGAFFLSTVVLLSVYSYSNSSQLEEKADRLGDLMISSGLNSLWDYDMPAMQDQIVKFFADRDISSVLVKDRNGSTLVEKKRDSLGDRDVFIKREYVIDNTRIGSLEIVVNNGSMIRSLRSMRLMLIILSLVIIVIIVFIVTKVSKRVFKNLPDLEEQVLKFSEGDLTDINNVVSPMGASLVGRERIHKDEVERLTSYFSHFAFEVIEIIRELQNLIVNLSASAEELQTASDSFSDNASRESSSAEQIFASVEQTSEYMNVINNQSNDQQKKIITFMEKMQALFELITGMTLLTENIRGEVEEINSRARSTESALSDMSSSMSNIRSSSERVNEIIQIIGNISDQINLLSLNAAIEAARAGKAGRGFAVVADQISQLADETAGSLKLITQLIANNDKEMAQGIESTGKTVDHTRIILEKIGSVNDKIDQLFKGMKAEESLSVSMKKSVLIVKDGADNIFKSTTHQHIALTEISQSVLGIHESSQETAGASRQLADRAEQINNSIESLNERISFFKLK